MYYYTQNYTTVTVPSRDIRALARESLAGKWKIAAVGTLIFLAVTAIPQIILSTVLGSIFAANLYSYLVTGAFNLGYAVFILNIFRNKEVDYSQLFCGFERILKTVGLYIYTSIFIFLWTLLFIVPGIIAAIRYSQAYYILADNPDMPITEIVNESKRMMSTNKAKYFCLGLSFIGWSLLAALPVSIYESVVSASAAVSAVMYSSSGMNFADIYQYAMDSIANMGFVSQMTTFVLEIGYLWVTPYMECANAALYEMIKGNLRPGIIDTTAAVVNNAEAISAETVSAQELPADAESDTENAEHKDAEAGTADADQKETKITE